MGRVMLFLVISYYLVWFGAVMSAAAGNVWLGFLIAVVFSIIAWQMIRQQLTLSVTFYRVTVIITACGFIVDSYFAASGIIHFHAAWPTAKLAPLWILGIWLYFAMVYQICLPLLHHRYVLLSLFSLLGFPMSYWAGGRLGAADFPYGIYSLTFIGCVWALLLPLISYTLLSKTPGE